MAKREWRSVRQRLSDVEEFSDWVYQSNNCFTQDLWARYCKLERLVYEALGEIHDELDKLNRQKKKSKK